MPWRDTHTQRGVSCHASSLLCQANVKDVMDVILFHFYFFRYESGLCRTLMTALWPLVSREFMLATNEFTMNSFSRPALYVERVLRAYKRVENRARVIWINYNFQLMPRRALKKVNIQIECVSCTSNVVRDFFLLLFHSLFFFISICA